MPQSEGKHIAVERTSKNDGCVEPYGTSVLLRLILASNVMAFTWSFSVLTTSMSSRNHKLPLIREEGILRSIKDSNFKFCLLARSEMNQMPGNEIDNENANTNQNMRNGKGKGNSRDDDDDTFDTNDYYGGLAPASSLLDRIKNGANYSDTNTDHENQELPLDENEPRSTSSKLANPDKSDWEYVQSDTGISTDLNSDGLEELEMERMRLRLHLEESIAMASQQLSLFPKESDEYDMLNDILTQPQQVLEAMALDEDVRISSEHRESSILSDDTIAGLERDGERPSLGKIIGSVGAVDKSTESEGLASSNAFLEKDVDSSEDGDSAEYDETKKAQLHLAENVLMEESKSMQEAVDDEVGTNAIAPDEDEQQAMLQKANEGAISQNEVQENENEEAHIEIQGTNEASESLKKVSLDKAGKEHKKERKDQQSPTDNHKVDVESLLGTLSTSQFPRINIDAKKMAAQIFAEKTMMQMQEEEERIKALEEQEMIETKREAKSLWEQIQSSQQEQVRLQNAKEAM
uniref:Uncharacterized protein n=1 Tax=Chaetoceros debilis TaxID=122233 RepID=A0A7S3VD93_9STRA